MSKRRRAAADKASAPRAAAASPKHATPHAHTPTPVFYALLRALHLLATTALLPLGLWHWLSLHPSTSDGVLLGIFFVGMVLSLFVIVLDQADYPVSLVGALVRTGPLFANAIAALWASGSDLLFAAYWTMTSLLAALAGLLGFLTVTAIVVMRRDRSLRQASAAIWFALVPAALGAFAILLVVGAPLARTVSVAPASLVSALAWVGHTVVTAQAWFRMSTFSTYLKTTSSQDRVRTFERSWTGPAALCVVASMVACVFELAFMSERAPR